MCCWMGLHFHDGLTFMGLQFYKSCQNEVANFQAFGDQKIQVHAAYMQGFKNKKDLQHIRFYNKCVSSFQGDQVKRIYKVDA